MIKHCSTLATNFDIPFYQNAKYVFRWKPIHPQSASGGSSITASIRSGKITETSARAASSHRLNSYPKPLKIMEIFIALPRMPSECRGSRAPSKLFPQVG